MFDIGFWELLVVGLIGLIILGPERLPKAIRSLQATIHKVRQFGSRMEAEINHELRVKELHDNLKKIEQADDLDNLPEDLKASLAQLQRAAASVNRPYAKPSAADNGSEAESSTSPDSTQPTDAPDPANPNPEESSDDKRQ